MAVTSTPNNSVRGKISKKEYCCNVYCVALALSAIVYWISIIFYQHNHYAYCSTGYLCGNLCVIIVLALVITVSNTAEHQMSLNLTQVRYLLLLVLLESQFISLVLLLIYCCLDIFYAIKRFNRVNLCMYRTVGYTGHADCVCPLHLQQHSQPTELCTVGVEATV